MRMEYMKLILGAKTLDRQFVSILNLLQYIHLICEINRQSYNQRTNFLIYQFFTICVKMQ
mgnify:FL=1